MNQRILADDTEAARTELAEANSALEEARQRIISDHNEQMLKRIETDEVGGINLSDEHQTINIKVDGAGMPLPPQYQDKSMLNLNGLTSVIRRISPATPQNVPVLYEMPV